MGESSTVEVTRLGRTYRTFNLCALLIRMLTLLPDCRQHFDRRHVFYAEERISNSTKQRGSLWTSGRRARLCKIIGRTLTTRRCIRRLQHRFDRLHKRTPQEEIMLRDAGLHTKYLSFRKPFPQSNYAKIPLSDGNVLLDYNICLLPYNKHYFPGYLFKDGHLGRCPRSWACHIRI